MNIEFQIPDEKIQNLSQNAKSELKNLCKDYTEEILDEASRIESSRRNPETDSEITASIIKEADIFSKRFPAPKKRSWWVKVIQIIAFISCIITGSLFDTDKFQDSKHVFLFIIVLFVAISTTVFLTFNKEPNG